MDSVEMVLRALEKKSKGTVAESYEILRELLEDTRAGVKNGPLSPSYNEAKANLARGLTAYGAPLPKRGGNS